MPGVGSRHRQQREVNHPGPPVAQAPRERHRMMTTRERLRIRGPSEEAAAGQC